MDEEIENARYNESPYKVDVEHNSSQQSERHDNYIGGYYQ